MKFYIASKLENYMQVQALAGKLKSAGWVHTYDWTKQALVKETNNETLKCIAIKEAEGVSDSDIVIVLTPQGRGTHTELGMAMALNKTVFLCHSDSTYFKGDDNTSAFYFHPNVIHANWRYRSNCEDSFKLSISTLDASPQRQMALGACVIFYMV